jgi:putative ABC transport system permease protein
MKNSLKVSFFLAKRGILHGNRSVFFLSAAVIALLFINLLFIPSLLKGASSRVTQQTVGTLTSDVIMIPTYSAKANDQEAILNEIRSRDDVAATTHMLTKWCRVRFMLSIQLRIRRCLQCLLLRDRC